MNIRIINSPSSLLIFKEHTLFSCFIRDSSQIPLAVKPEPDCYRSIPGAWQDGSLWSVVVWKSGACTSVRAVITSHRTHSAGRFSTTLHFQTLDGCREKDSGLRTFLHWFIFIFTHAVRHHRSVQTRGCMGKMSTRFQVRLEWCKYLWHDMQCFKDDAGLHDIGKKSAIWKKYRNF